VCTCSRQQFGLVAEQTHVVECAERVVAEPEVGRGTQDQDVDAQSDGGSGEVEDGVAGDRARGTGVITDGD
jgi:hypothetical protein